MAWNGGGSSNLTDIIHDGGHTSSATLSIDDFVADHLEEIDEQIKATEEQFEEARESLTKNFEKTSSVAAKKAQKIRGKINDLVAEELREFFDEVQ